MFIAWTESDSVSAAKPQNQGSGGSGTEGTVSSIGDWDQGPGARDRGPGIGATDRGLVGLVGLVAPGSLGRWDR